MNNTTRNQFNTIVFFVLAALSGLTTGCQLTYFARGFSEGIRILNLRRPVEKVLADPATPQELKRKLALASQVRAFAESTLALKTGHNYTTYVHLDRPYVSWIVQAAPQFSLEPHRWWFPIVGNVPYKGFFAEKDALAEAKEFDANQFDTYVRGVSAFSSLGWVGDPLLSTMMSYDDFSLAEVVIHESVHATIYIKGQTDFNEQLATYLGEKGAKLYFLSVEGQGSPTLKGEEDSEFDEKLFHTFLRAEIKELDTWYRSLHGSQPREEKLMKIENLKNRFRATILPQLKTKRYRKFADQDINNAYLSGIASYYKDLEDFAKLDQKLGGEFKVVLQFCRNLEKSKDPLEDLKTFVAGSTSAYASPPNAERYALSQHGSHR